MLLNGKRRALSHLRKINQTHLLLSKGSLKDLHSSCIMREKGLQEEASRVRLELGRRERVLREVLDSKGLGGHG